MHVFTLLPIKHLGLDDETPDDKVASFLTENYPENAFSIIIIDECHRSAWGKWSEVSET